MEWLIILKYNKFAIGKISRYYFEKSNKNLAVLAVWKVLIPLFLQGYNAVIVGMVTTLTLICVIIGLVYGIDKKSLAAITGSLAGALLTCFMALFFVSKFRIHGAVMSYSESLLYSGYEGLNLLAYL